ncbi:MULTISPECIES: hypothetical protein [Cyanophyceae]|uniref:Protein kinase domain-containing protein n=1 Tax=Leptolyngbya subtilissima DQ-A4 TaxID=2933933 RepID=A0ABV0JYN9_9CYAN|nr:hypothetical protein [Nodosilinea sp. FACHB-141]MBD2112276.1 hypothetical protein [Nodosilinea sp. FACHB-141]
MTLAVGTALQNGTYVIDAWVAEDAVGPVYLAMDVSKGQWIQLRILGSRSPATLPDVSQRQVFYRYLDQVNSLKQAAFPARLGGFEEEGVCYQTLASPPGTPLDRLVTEANSLAPRSSMAIVQRLTEAFEALHPLGWAGLRLTPDQVWYEPQEQTITFTGFDLPPSTPVIPQPIDKNVSPEESALVRGLTHLLYFLLTGQRAEATNAPLTVEVRRRHPELPTVVNTALALGSPRPLNGATPTLQEPTPTVTLAEWKALLPPPEQLPATPAPSAVSSAAPQRFTGPPTRVVFGQSDPGAQPQTKVDYPAQVNTLVSSTQRQNRSLPMLALVVTGLMATISGLGFGFYARLQPASSASQERLNPNQSFPPLPDWNGDDLLQPWADAPARRDRPDYSNTPPPGSAPVPDFTPNPQEPAAPPPAVPQPEIVPEPIPEPVEDWETPVPTQPEPIPEFEPIFPSDPAPLPVEPAPAPQPLPAPVLVEPVPTEEAAPAPLAPAPLAPPAPTPSSS